MDLLKGNVRQIYFRYLGAAFGSALISSIYGLVDSAMVGQYQGAGGHGRAGHRRAGVEHHLQPGAADRHRRLGSEARRGAGRQKEGNEYFTAALAGTVFFAAVSWLAIVFSTRRCCACSARARVAAGAAISAPSSNSWCRCSCSTRCWRRSCATTARGACHGGGWRAASSCVRRFFVFTRHMGAWRGWQQLLARASPSR